MKTQFAQDVQQGLSSGPKRLSSKYFYDKDGDALFQEIMQMPEYYLTRSEFEILEMNKEPLLDLFLNSRGRFNLIEFGAGDGLKTKILLRHFVEQQADFRYVPVDISGNVLQGLEKDLKEELPELQVEPVEDDYFRALERLTQTADRRNIVLFLGSNIGNFSEQQAMRFLTELGNGLNQGDLILVGFDLKKDPELIRSAYNDPAGITRAFNMNLLKRINREMGGRFDLQKFQHYQMYDPVGGEARSYLISKEAQEVYIEALAQTFYFKAWEPVHVEISRKYEPETIEMYASGSGFGLVKHFYDCKHYYVNSLWEKK